MIKIRVSVDSREKKRIEDATEYYEMRNIIVTKETLEYGDYLFQANNSKNKVVFEYKTMGDMLASITNQTVFEEVMNQTHEYDYSYLIIAGDLSTYLDVLWKQENVKGKFKSFKKFHDYYFTRFWGAIRRLRTAVNVILVDSETSAFYEMMMQAKKCFDVKFYGGCRKPDNLKSCLDSVLCDVKLVSVKKSRKIINDLHLRTLQDLVDCSENDFASVDTIGENTANKIFKWVHPEGAKT